MTKYFIKKEHHNKVIELAKGYNVPDKDGKVDILDLLKFISESKISQFVSAEINMRWATSENGIYDDPDELTGWSSGRFRTVREDLNNYNTMHKAYMTKKNTHYYIGDYKMVVANVINILDIKTITFTNSPILGEPANFDVPYTHFCTEVSLDHTVTLEARTFIQRRTFAREERASLKFIALKGNLTLLGKIFPKFPKTFKIDGMLLVGVELMTFQNYLRVLDNLNTMNKPSISDSNEIPFPDVTGNTLHVGDMVAFVPSTSSPIHIGLVAGCTPQRIRVQSSFTQDKFTVQSSQIARIV